MNDLFTTNGFNVNGLLNSLGNFLLAIIVLLIGYVIAKAIGKGVEKLLVKTGVVKKYLSSSRVQTRDNAEKKDSYPPEKIAGKIIFYILMVFVLILFFNILNLTIIASPLVEMTSTILAFIPNILRAALILLFAYVIALLLKTLVVKGGTKLLQSRSVRENKYLKDRSNVQDYAIYAGNIVFYVVLLFFLPGVLGSLGIDAVSQPFSNLLATLLAFIPRLFAAALIFAIGWIVAKIVRDIVSNFLHAVGTDRLAERIGLTKSLKDTTVSSIIGTVVFVLIMIPITISALDQLQIAGITDPAINMLNDVMAMLPNILIAIALVLVGLWVGKWVRKVVSDLLDRLSFNNVTRYLKVGNMKTTTSPSDIVGYVAQVIVVLLFVVEAFQLVNLNFMVELGTAIVAFLPSVLTALIILALGIMLGNISKRVLDSVVGSSTLSFLSSLAKYAIIALALFMALDQLGVAESIVTSAFTLILGALALAFGLAFGLGGKEHASRYLSKLEKRAEQAELTPENAADAMKEMKEEARPSTHTGQTASHPATEGSDDDLIHYEDLSNTDSAWDENSDGEQPPNESPYNDDNLPPNR